MKAVTNDYKAAAIANNRHPAAKGFVSWDRAYESGADYFTIGVSTIGGNDVIKGNNDNISESEKYLYNEESGYLMSLEYDRQFTEPVFSVAKAMADVVLDNNSDRFTPGSDPDIGDDIKRRRPLKLYLGFSPSVEYTQVFVGEIADNPKIDSKNKTVSLYAEDFITSLWGRVIDDTTFYENKRSDELIAVLLQAAGLVDGQYVLDEGEYTIPFAFIPAGAKIGDIIYQLCEAEQGVFFLDEDGYFRFWNRTHLNNSPHTISQVTITDDLVLSEEDPDVDTVINSVVVKGYPRQVVASNELIAEVKDSRLVPSGSTLEFFINYNDPIYSLVTPAGANPTTTSYFRGYQNRDGSGSDYTSDLSLAMVNFSSSSKLTFTNSSGHDVFLTELAVYGKPAVKTPDQGIYAKYQDDTSISANGLSTHEINNDYIQTYEQAYNIAYDLVVDRKDPASYKKMTIRALPHLQLGDRVTRSSNDYYVIRIKTKFTPGDGLVQELTMVKRTISS